MGIFIIQSKIKNNKEIRNKISRLNDHVKSQRVNFNINKAVIPKERETINTKINTK